MGIKLNKEKVLEKYRAKTKGSNDLFKRSLESIPGGLHHFGRLFQPYPLFMREGKGPFLTDVDGNRYVDYWMGHGALILGHAYGKIVEAVNEVNMRSSHLGTPNEVEVELCELIRELVPSMERVKLCLSGTEATMHAIRLARAYTGKDTIAKMAGHFHGIHDSVFIGVYPPFEVPSCLGIPGDIAKHTRLLPFNDIEGTQAVLDRIKNSLAAVILEPVKGGGAIPAKKEYLKFIRDYCTRNNIILIFDEVITGFRLSPGGAQRFYGVQADITTFAKVLFGGYPGGALGGRADIMKMSEATFSKIKNQQTRAMIQGTFVGNPISSTAGVCVLKEIRDGKVHERIKRAWEDLKKGLNKVFEELDVDAKAIGEGSIFELHFVPRDREIINIYDLVDANTELKFYFYLELINRGHYFLPPHFGTISITHGDEHLKKLVEDARAILSEWKE